MYELPVIAREQPKSHVRSFILSIASIAVVTMLGYLGFVIFLKDVMPAFSLYSLYLIAIIAGVATFFSPCSFPLLPGYLSFYYQASHNKRENPTLYYGILAALGVLSFNLILGAVIALFGEGVATTLSISNPTPSPLTRMLRIGIGAILVALGAIQLSNFTFHTRILDVLTKRFSAATRAGGKGLYLYGFGYNIAGMGCAGPIMAGLIVFSLGSGGFANAFVAFIIYSLTMVLLMLAISMLVAHSKNILITRLKASATTIKKAASILLLVVGAFVIYATINLQFFVRALFP